MNETTKIGNQIVVIADDEHFLILYAICCKISPVRLSTT